MALTHCSPSWPVLSVLLLAPPILAGDERFFATSPDLPDARVVPARREFEFTLEKPVDYGVQQSFRDVQLSTVFTAPGGARSTVDGFYFDTRRDGATPRSLWKTRFVPREPGVWYYAWSFLHVPSGYRAAGVGSFLCVASAERGYLVHNAANPRQWVSETGESVHLVGTNENLDQASIGWLEGGANFGAFVGPVTPVDAVFTAYADGGFNLLRINGCLQLLATVAPEPQPWTYRADAALFLDDYTLRARRAGLRLFMTLFQDYGQASWTTRPEETAYIRYFVARYGSRADVLQCHNEAMADRAWYAAVRDEVRRRETWPHPIAATWYQAGTPSVEQASTGLDLVTPHYYQADTAFDADAVLATRAATWRRYGKPVVLSECGGAANAAREASPWTPDSPLRWRLRSWAGLAWQVGLVPWNGSGNTGPVQANQGTLVNQYLGAEERQYTRIQQWAARQVLRPDCAPTSGVTTTAPNFVRLHALQSSETLLVYLHHHTDHTTRVMGSRLSFSAARAGTGLWLDPQSGAIRGLTNVSRGPNYGVLVPDFTVDLALVVAPSFSGTSPVALLRVQNPQDDGDLDNDNRPDYGPAGLPCGVAPLTLHFDGAASFDAGGQPLRFEWDFGDGSPVATLPQASHTYGPGQFLARLTVTDPDGNVSRCSLAVRASADARPDSNDPPLANRQPADLFVREGQAVILTPWGHDDELQTVNGALRYVRMSQAVVHSSTALPPGATWGTRGASWLTNFVWVPDFTQAGDWTVTLQARDAGGLAAVPQVVRIHVLNADDEPLVGAPQVGPGPRPDQVTITAPIFDPNGLTDLLATLAVYVDPQGRIAGWSPMFDVGNGSFRSPLSPRLGAGAWSTWVVGLDRSGAIGVNLVRFRL